jgi:hypothetical protein
MSTTRAPVQGAATPEDIEAGRAKLMARDALNAAISSISAGGYKPDWLTEAMYSSIGGKDGLISTMQSLMASEKDFIRLQAMKMAVAVFERSEDRNHDSRKEMTKAMMGTDEWKERFRETVIRMLNQQPAEVDLSTQPQDAVDVETIE